MDSAVVLSPKDTEAGFHRNEAMGFLSTFQTPQDSKVAISTTTNSSSSSRIMSLLCTPSRFRQSSLSSWNRSQQPCRSGPTNHNHDHRAAIMTPTIFQNAPLLPDTPLSEDRNTTDCDVQQQQQQQQRLPRVPLLPLSRPRKGIAGILNADSNNAADDDDIMPTLTPVEGYNVVMTGIFARYHHHHHDHITTSPSSRKDDCLNGGNNIDQPLPLLYVDDDDDDDDSDHHHHHHHHDENDDDNNHTTADAAATESRTLRPPMRSTTTILRPAPKLKMLHSMHDIQQRLPL